MNTATATVNEKAAAYLDELDRNAAEQVQARARRPLHDAERKAAKQDQQQTPGDGQSTGDNQSEGGAEQSGGEFPMLRGALTIDKLRAYLDARGISARYNLISHKIEYTGIPDRYQTEQTNEQAHTIIRSMLTADGGGKTSKATADNVASFLEVIAAQCEFNPLRELLDRVQWDKVDRMPELYSILRLADGDELSRTLLRKWMMQAISVCLYNTRRAPFGADGVLVLTGAQGIGKTRFARRLGISAELFKEGLLIDPDNKDTILRATSCFIGEIGELERTMKRDIPALKAFFTAESDEIRKPYGRTSETHARRTSYIATCNSGDFLRDETGNRRYWTIECAERFDLKRLDALDVMQVWAQVLHMVNEQGRQAFRLTPAESAALAERNAGHAVELPAQSEILDILARTETDARYVFDNITVSEFMRYYDELRRYTAAQIGKALDAANIPQNRIHGGTRCRYLPRPKLDTIQESRKR